MSKQTVMMNKQSIRMPHCMYLLESHYEALRFFPTFIASRSDTGKTCGMRSGSRAGGPRIKTTINLKPARPPHTSTAWRRRGDARRREPEAPARRPARRAT
jgi:hypothetical protein